VCGKARRDDGLGDVEVEVEVEVEAVRTEQVW